MSGALEVRPGREEDAEAIHAVHVAAFAPSKVEAEIFDGLRADGDLVPSLSFAALRDGAVVGHVAISRAWVDRDDDGGTAEALGLGPIGVPPALQRAGVGGALMRATLAAAGETAFPLIALLGHVEYYPRFGFEPAAPLGSGARIRSPRRTGWRTGCPRTTRRCAARSATRPRSRGRRRPRGSCCRDCRGR